jgi:hypothetical protein
MLLAVFSRKTAGRATLSLENAPDLPGVFPLIANIADYQNITLHAGHLKGFTVSPPS